MKEPMNRRECLRMFGISGLTAGLGVISSRQLFGQEVGESSGFQSSILATHEAQSTRGAAMIIDIICR